MCACSALRLVRIRARLLWKGVLFRDKLASICARVRRLDLLEYARVCFVEACEGCLCIWGLQRMFAHMKAQCVDFDIDFGLQKSLQQDPPHDGRWAEEHRQGSDVVVGGAPTTNHSLWRSFEVRLDLLFLTRGSCWRRWSSIFAERRHRIVFVTVMPSRGELRKVALLQRKAADDSKAYAKEKEIRLAKAWCFI